MQKPEKYDIIIIVVSTFLRQSPFFLASVLVHFIILILFSLKIYAEVNKKITKNNDVIEVKLISHREEIKPEKSIIEYKDAKQTQKMPVYLKREKIEIVKNEFPQNDFSAPLKVLTDKGTPEREIRESENKIRRKEVNNNQIATITSRILYKKKTDPVIKIDKSQNRVAKQLTDNNANEKSPAQKMTFGIESTGLDHKNNEAVSYSETPLEQDYELIRRFIEGKVNKFVPIVYQKKLVERKKRVALVQMTIGQSGYVNSHIILKSTGLAEMDRSIHAILHLAEPYVFVPRPVDIEIVFYE